MKQVSIDRIASNFSNYMKIAENDNIIITRDGKSIGILMGWQDSENWWEELFLRDPRFQDRIARSRQSLRDGKTKTIEEIRAKGKIRALISFVIEMRSLCLLSVLGGAIVKCLRMRIVGYYLPCNFNKTFTRSQ